MDMKVRVEITDMDMYKDIVKILKDIVIDERIDSNVRAEYKDKLLDTVEAYNCKNTRSLL